IAAAGHKPATPPGLGIDARIEQGASMLTLAVTLLIGSFWMNLATDMTSLVEPIRRIKPHPTLLAITPDVAIGHPLVRRLEGSWVGSTGSLWITAGALKRQWNETPARAEAERLASAVARDRSILSRDIRRERPD